MDPARESALNLRNSVKENVKQATIRVYQTLLVKHIRQNADGELTLIGTVIQRCVKPKDMDASELLQFKYRVNDELFVMDNDSGRCRNVRVKDDESLIASVGTYRVGIPLTKHSLWQMYPFRIGYCSAKMELSTSELDGVTYRPDLYYIGGVPKSFVAVKNEEDLDMMASYDLMTHTPYVYGEAQNKGKDTFYTPIMYVGFYLMDPVILTLINTFLPIVLVLVLLAATVMYEEDEETCMMSGSKTRSECAGGREPMDGADYVAQLTGISLTAVFLLPTLRNTDAARTSIQVVDVFIMLVFGGIVVSALGTIYIKLRKYGCLISWLSMVIPVLGKYYFERLARKLSRMDALSLNKAAVKDKKKPWFKMTWGFCMENDAVCAVKSNSEATYGASLEKPTEKKAKGEDVHLRQLVPFTDPDLRRNGKFIDTHWGYTPRMVEKGDRKMGEPKKVNKNAAGVAVTASTVPSLGISPGKPQEILSLHSLPPGTPPGSPEASR